MDRYNNQDKSIIDDFFDSIELIDFKECIRWSPFIILTSLYLYSVFNNKPAIPEHRDRKSFCSIPCLPSNSVSYITSIQPAL